MSDNYTQGPSPRDTSSSQTLSSVPEQNEQDRFAQQEHQQDQQEYQQLQSLNLEALQAHEHQLHDKPDDYGQQREEQFFVPYV